MESVGITQGASMLYYSMWVDVKEKSSAGSVRLRAGRPLLSLSSVKMVELFYTAARCGAVGRRSFWSRRENCPRPYRRQAPLSSYFGACTQL